MTENKRGSASFVVMDMSDCANADQGLAKQPHIERDLPGRVERLDDNMAVKEIDPEGLVYKGGPSPDRQGRMLSNDPREVRANTAEIGLQRAKADAGNLKGERDKARHDASSHQASSAKERSERIKVMDDLSKEKQRASKYRDRSRERALAHSEERIAHLDTKLAAQRAREEATKKIYGLEGKLSRFKKIGIPLAAAATAGSYLLGRHQGKPAEKRALEIEAKELDGNIEVKGATSGLKKLGRHLTDFGHGIENRIKDNLEDEGMAVAGRLRSKARRAKLNKDPMRESLHNFEADAIESSGKAARSIGVRQKAKRLARGGVVAGMAGVAGAKYGNKETKGIETVPDTLDMPEGMGTMGGPGDDMANAADTNKPQNFATGAPIVEKKGALGRDIARATTNAFKSGKNKILAGINKKKLIKPGDSLQKRSLLGLEPGFSVKRVSELEDSIETKGVVREGLKDAGKYAADKFATGALFGSGVIAAGLAAHKAQVSDPKKPVRIRIVDESIKASAKRERKEFSGSIETKNIVSEALNRARKFVGRVRPEVPVVRPQSTVPFPKRSRSAFGQTGMERPKPKAVAGPGTQISEADWNAAQNKRQQAAKAQERAAKAQQEANSAEQQVEKKKRSSGRAMLGAGLLGTGFALGSTNDAALKGIKVSGRKKR